MSNWPNLRRRRPDRPHPFDAKTHKIPPAQHKKPGRAVGHPGVNRPIPDRINWTHGTDGWQPVVFLNEHHGPEDIFALYRAATGCVVSSLHDGMNLVAKEFVSARGDDRGVLVLSKFTGAARELPDAVLVNPFDVEETADGLFAALTMPAAEQERRMRRMRAQVDDHNIYRWAGMLLSEVGKRVPDPLPLAEDADEEDPQLARREQATEERIAAANYLTAMHLASAGL